MNADGEPTRRKVATNPHPDMEEAVAVTRFWRNVANGPADQCWPWIGDNDKGYGIFYYHGRMYRATELALAFWTGEVRGESLDTCHSCDNPICVNPRHLRFDTRQSNVDDMVERERASTAGQKLTDGQIVTMRERRAAGARQKDLAKQYDISNGRVSEIVRGHCRRNAGGPLQTERKARK